MLDCASPEPDSAGFVALEVEVVAGDVVGVEAVGVVEDVGGVVDAGDGAGVGDGSGVGAGGGDLLD